MHSERALSVLSQNTQGQLAAAFRERKTRIQKDVPRTDRRHPLFRAPDSEHSALMYRVLMSYMMWNFDLGYCQGMSDLLSPLIVVLAGAEGLPGGDSDACDAVEADCFWCFDRLMGMVGANFDQDQSGMHAQLLALARLLEALDPPLFQHLQRVSADSGPEYARECTRALHSACCSAMFHNAHMPDVGVRHLYSFSSNPG